MNTTLKPRLRFWLILVFCFVPWAADLTLAQPRLARPDALSEAHHKSGLATLRAFGRVADATRESVVRFQLAGETVALGAIVSAEGLTLTKASEVHGGELTGILSGDREVPARIVGVSDENDLALVQLEAVGLTPVLWAAEPTAIGQWVITPGPDSVPEAVGIVSAPLRRVAHRRALIGVRLDLGRREPVVASLLPGMGAERAGLALGDRVLAVNDSEVDDREEMIQKLREFRVGQWVRLRIQRDQETIELDVEMQLPAVDPAMSTLDRGERMNQMGSTLSRRADGFEEVLTHDTVLHAWQCGGPLVNLEGHAIGLNIARAGRVLSYALPAARARETAEILIAELQSSP